MSGPGGHLKDSDGVGHTMPARKATGQGRSDDQNNERIVEEKQKVRRVIDRRREKEQNEQSGKQRAPAGHMASSVAPRCVQKAPSEHFAHRVAPARAYVPGAHSVEAVRPEELGRQETRRTMR